MVLVLLAGVMIAFAVAGAVVTRREDNRLEVERHAALRLALDEFHAVFGDADRFDYAQLQLIARRTGLDDLRFDTDPTAIPGREEQSLQDSQGRIVGWFSWAPDRALFDAMDWLWRLAGTAGVALALCALLAAVVHRRLSRSVLHSNEMVRKLTSEDALTGLPNHRVMLERLNDALKRRRTESVVLLVIDLDGFREVNDALGRSGGDAVFTQITERLKTGLPAGAQFGRFEDDELAVIVTRDDARNATAVADTLRAALTRPIFVDQIWQISACIGVAQAPEDATTGEELSRRAGLALRAAKREGRGTMRRFVPQIEAEHSERRFLLRQLETAISAQALDVHYQPIVAAAGGGIVGVEALLRWTHKTRGVIPPSVFIPLAEQSGLMHQLGEFVLRRALADGARWPDLSVAVNLSPLQIRDRNLVALVGAVMAETGVASSQVVLEVTEGVLIDDPQQALIRLEALRALGVGIALDDFGTGYSSLSYLQKFPFSQIKIDRAFVASLGTTGHAGVIIQSIVTLGHALGMKVLAEGVETDEQRVLLRLAGCDEMQGYLFARPCPAEAIDKVLARSSSQLTTQGKAAEAAS
jgi:diguanylate cyclase (GGDEF)-like protein